MARLHWMSVGVCAGFLILAGSPALAVKYQAYFKEGTNKYGLYHIQSQCGPGDCVTFGTLCNRKYYSREYTLQKAHEIIDDGGTLYIRDADDGEVICEVS